MRGLFEIVNDAYTEVYKITHLGFSQFDMDVKQFNREMDKDLFEGSPNFFTDEKSNLNDPR